LMEDEYHVVRAFFHRFDFRPFFTGTPIERLTLIPNAMEHILRQTDGKKRFMNGVVRLSKAFALAVPHERALALRDEIAFFQAVRTAFVKTTPSEGHSADAVEGAVRQLVSEAIASDSVINILDAAGLKSPDISILSDDFLDDMKKLPQKNLALEVLRKLLNDEIKSRSRTNVIQSRSFAEMLEQSVRRYQNRAIDAAEVMTELIKLAKEIQAAQKRGEDLRLTEDEIAFYDALIDNQSAKEALGDDSLAAIARELVKVLRANVTIDWTVKQSARSRLRVLVKRLLRQYGYPPDFQESATTLVLEQAELFAAHWAV
jgi:type I restriction enzyme R subunit